MILLAYVSTIESIDRFINAQNWQQMFSLPPCQKVLFTDVADSVPGVNMPCIKVRDAKNQHGIMLTRLKNAAVKYAMSIQTDWVWIIEADFVILQFPALPERGWIIPQSLNDLPDKLTFEPERRLLQVNCHLFHQALLPLAVYDEGYEGAGYDDLDFNNTMIHTHKILPTPSNALMVHLFHPTRADIRPENKRRYLTKWGHLHQP